MSYREKLWNHKPLTDFWRVGPGISRKLEQNGMFTMGDIARCSEGRETDYYNEDLLYKLFGVNAELLIDHAWGWEPSEIADCKAYKPESKSLSQGQVLSRPYSFDEGRTVVLEMADQLSIDLVRAGLFTDQVVLDVGYDIENLTNQTKAIEYKGAIVSDHYGRQVPKPVHGSKNLGRQTSSTKRIMSAVAEIYDKIVDQRLSVRRFTVAVTHLVPEQEAKSVTPETEQLDLFTDYEALDRQRQAEEAELDQELKLQKALISIRDKFGKNAIVKGLNMKEGATAIERNSQIGGHKA
jgi:DNA polymerase V